jgi:hypothetical protein
MPSVRLLAARALELCDDFYHCIVPRRDILKIKEVIVKVPSPSIESKKPVDNRAGLREYTTRWTWADSNPQISTFGKMKDYVVDIN